jgi:cytochrome P450
MTSEITTSALGGNRWADLPQLPGLFSTEYQDDPHRFHRQALEQSPLAVGPLGLVALSYEAARTVQRDPRFGRPPALGLAGLGVTSGPLWERAAESLLSLDGEEHRRLRKLVVRALTPACAARLHATMTDVISELTDAVSAAGRCDLVADVARRYPIPIICELLGAPREDWQLFSAWTDDIFRIFTLGAATEAPSILAAIEEMHAYLDQLVDRRRHTLSDDLISNLIRAEEDGDRLTHDELLMVAASVLAGGTDTTRNQLAAGVQVFCDHPGQWALLAAQPELAPQAVEEVMRYAPVILGTLRTTLEDVELAGLLIPAGTSVVASTAAANRDPSVYADPDRFDITRQAPEPMLTFGGGTHYCLGVHLAKAELAVALATLASRMPNIRRTGPAPWKPVIGITGPITLPVQFDPGH